MLWNLFYADARSAIIESGFKELIYADDLIAYKALPEGFDNEICIVEAEAAQHRLHAWGAANQVLLGNSKEASILCPPPLRGAARSRSSV